MGTGILVVFYAAIGSVVGLFVGRLLRRGLEFGTLAGIAAVLITDRAFIPLVSWDDPFFWEGTLRLVALAIVPVSIAAWIGNRLRRKSELRSN